MEQSVDSRKNLFSSDWMVVATLTLAMIGFYGAELSFSVFLKPLVKEFGWTRAAASGSMSIAEGIAGLLGIVVGVLSDKYGTRILLASGGIFGGLGYLLMSSAGTLWQLYLFSGIMTGISIAVCWTSINATISRLFSDKRLLALGITTSGITIGNMVLPPLTAQIIAAFGWRFAYLVLAFVVWITTIPAAISLGNKRSNRIGRGQGNVLNKNGRKYSVEPVQQREPLTFQVAKTVPFWMLMITGFVTAAGYYFVATHIVAFATDIGIAPTSAPLIFLCMGAGNIAGKLLVWSMALKIGNRSLLFVLLALQAVAFFFLMKTTSFLVLLALGGIFGFGFGGSSPVRMSMIPEFFGMRHVGTIIGLVGVSWGVGGITGPILAGYFFDQSGSYNAAFLCGGLIMVVGIVATCFLKAPTR